MISPMRLLLFVQCLITTALALTNFTPKVESKCLNSSLFIKVVNNSPFFGIIHPTGPATSECSFVGSGGAVSEFELDYDKCDIHYDKKTKKRLLRLEVHEHKSLLLNNDQTVDIECQASDKPKKVQTTTPATMLLSDEMEIDSAIENVTTDFEQQPSVNFDLEFISNEGTERSTKIAYHADIYNLKLTIHEPIRRKFRVHSCFASSPNNRVELISSNGCSLDKDLLKDFEYGNQSASAQIPGMFYFTDSRSVTFECSLKICTEKEECKPNCMLKLDDPVGEDPELVSKLLRSSLPDEEISSSGLSPPPLTVRKNTASITVHVVERRETLPSSVSPTETNEPSTERISITGCRCDFPSDLVLLYKLCIGLSLLFALGCCCNVMFCCLNVRGKNATKKRRSVPKTIAQSTLTRNQYWINEPVVREQPGSAFEEFPSQYTEMHAPITDTYATLRPRNKTSIEHPVSLIGFQPNGQPINNTGFQYDTNAASVISALSNYNNNRSSPPRSSTYEVPNNRTFHSGSNSDCTASPRNSFDNSALNPVNSINNAMISSTTSANTANTAPTINNDSPQQQFLTLASENPKETYSIL